jgi:hypothetical protein
MSLLLSHDVLQEEAIASYPTVGRSIAQPRLQPTNHVAQQAHETRLAEFINYLCAHLWTVFTGLCGLATLPLRSIASATIRQLPSLVSDRSTPSLIIQTMPVPSLHFSALLMFS